jgi:hypothetical protein
MRMKNRKIIIKRMSIMKKGMIKRIPMNQQRLKPSLKREIV